MPRGGARHIKAYSITRDGFTFLAMGFTGPKAAHWKEAYISAFNQMEAALRNNSTPPAYNRVMVFMDCDGVQRIKPIPNDAYVLSRAEIVRAIGCDQDLPLGPAELAEVINGASGRLARVLGQVREVR